MTKTEYEMQDFSYKNLLGWMVIFVVLGVGYKLTRKK